MIDIRLLNKKHLNEYINSDIFADQDNIPISKHRALSHFNNPRLDEDDIILLLAYENDRMIGYLGVLPDKIFFSNNLNITGIGHHPGCRIPALARSIVRINAGRGLDPFIFHQVGV